MRRLLGVAAVVVTGLAVAGFVASSSGARQAPSRVGAIAAKSSVAPAGNVVVNESPLRATTSYWSSDRLANAQPLTPTIDAPAVSPNSYGTSALDFTRSRIAPAGANKSAPYKFAGKLFFTKPGVGDFVCSASVVQNRLVATAAHCMYSAGVGFHTNWVFIPGYDGTQGTLAKQRPWGTWTWSSGEIPVNWINSGGALPNATDFGILVMVDQGGSNIRSVVGGKFTPVVGHLFDNNVTMLGYPCNFDSCLIMQRNDGGDHRSAGNNAYEYGSDMTGGSSGGPWVENFGNTGSAPPTGNWTTRNGIVAVTSYVYNDPNIRVLGASQFDANWTTIYNNRCAANAGNC
jgi:V8-like Glu-specific endopeptidase